MDKFMEIALEEAKLGLAQGGIPIGAVLVKDGKVIGKGHNMRVQENDVTAHAEINCLKNAGRIGSYKDTVIYSTLSPCIMCSGAIVLFGIKKVYIGENENFLGGEQLLRDNGVEVINLNSPQCKEIMAAFIKQKPHLWHEDIGKL